MNKKRDILYTNKFQSQALYGFQLVINYLPHIEVLFVTFVGKLVGIDVVG
jgi:hypothetical protein